MYCARAKRVRALVLYATETGRSQMFAHQLHSILDYAFNSRVVCMDTYEPMELEHERLIFFVVSTFGDGDPPENGRVG